MLHDGLQVVSKDPAIYPFSYSHFGGPLIENLPLPTTTVLQQPAVTSSPESRLAYDRIIAEY